jgi:gamma-F420-2:alpha-L-glutamate ligase
MTGWMIYWKEDAEKNAAYIQWFQDEGVKLGMKIELKLLKLDRRDLLGLKAGEVLPDFVLNRSRNFQVAEWLESKGVRCINSALVSRIANDKEETYHHLFKHGVKVMPTWGRLVDKNIKNQQDCGYPLVAKSVDGHGGSEVFLVKGKADWKPVEEGLNGRRIVIQPVCGMPGCDLRVFVLGGAVIGAVLRESISDFRANYSLGGSVRLVELTAAQKSLIDQVLACLPLEWGGIDLLFDSEDDCLVNEVEDAVGSRSLSKLTDLNIARMVLTYIRDSQAGV